MSSLSVGCIVSVFVLFGCNSGGDLSRERPVEVSGNIENAGEHFLIVHRPTAVIGVLEGDATQEFGLIQDVATDDQGRIYTLDSRYQRIRVYDKDGDLIAEAGRGGRGPGEYFIPRSLIVDEEGMIHVLDQGNMRINQYSLDDNELRILGSTPFQSLAVDFCVLGDHYILYGHDAAGVIRILDRDGTVVRYILPPTPDSSVTRQRRAATGPMACNLEHQMIVIGAQQNGTVRAFRADGEVAWSTTLPGFIGLATTDGRDGSVTYSVSDVGYFHQVESLFFVNRRVLAVQWLKIGEGSGPGDVPILQILTYYLDALDGSQVGVQTNLPLIRRAYGSYILSVTSDPFPQVARHSSETITSKP